MRISLSLIAIAATVSLWHSPAHAQTPINAPGAMQPSTGTGVVHFMPLYRKRDADPTLGDLGADEYIALTQIAYGVAHNFSLQFDVPLVYASIDTGNGRDRDFNVADMTLLAKYRFFQHDFGPTETVRASAIGGLNIPGSSDFRMDASHDAWNPIIGGVFSTVFGRHGVNTSLLYEFHTGGGREAFTDSLRYDASYLFRVTPAAFTPEITDAWYLVAELNGFYDINGDHEVFLSPGIMFESRRFTLDATVMIPIYQQLDFRAETDVIVGVGARISF